VGVVAVAHLLARHAEESQIHPLDADLKLPAGLQLANPTETPRRLSPGRLWWLPSPPMVLPHDVSLWVPLLVSPSPQ
jgi:hypothetical protein